MESWGREEGSRDNCYASSALVVYVTGDFAYSVSDSEKSSQLESEF
jgi:hypothetical protein